MTVPRLVCDQVTVTVGRANADRRAILDNLSATFTAGGVTLVTGDTGAGKTTLLHVLACLQRPTAGQVVYDGAPVSRWSSPHRDRWRRRVGIVFQTGRFLEDLSALENVLVPLVPQGLTTHEMTARCRDILERLSLTRQMRGPVSELSTGERQRVSVARAMVSRPAIILADEPTAHQDARQAEGIMTLLSETACQHQAVVVMTAHDPRVAGHRAVTAALRLLGGRLEPSS